MYVTAKILRSCNHQINSHSVTGIELYFLYISSGVLYKYIHAFQVSSKCNDSVGMDAFKVLNKKLNSEYLTNCSEPRADGYFKKQKCVYCHRKRVKLWFLCCRGTIKQLPPSHCACETTQHQFCMHCPCATFTSIG